LESSRKFRPLRHGRFVNRWRLRTALGLLDDRSKSSGNDAGRHLEHRLRFQNFCGAVQIGVGADVHVGVEDVLGLDLLLVGDEGRVMRLLNLRREHGLGLDGDAGLTGSGHRVAMRKRHTVRLHQRSRGGCDGTWGWSFEFVRRGRHKVWLRLRRGGREHAEHRLADAAVQWFLTAGGDAYGLGHGAVRKNDRLAGDW